MASKYISINKRPAKGLKGHAPAVTHVAGKPARKAGGPALFHRTSEGGKLKL